MYKLKRFFVILMVAILTVNVFPMQLYGKELSNEKKRIVVSLGDSYSSGEGIPEFYGQEKPLSVKVNDPDWLAHRSKKSWPGRLKLPEVGMMCDHRNENWYFVASSGAETKHLYKKQKKSYWKLNEKGSVNLNPQLDVFEKIPGQADYVTLTLGGNDADFVKVVQSCIFTTKELDVNGLGRKLNSVWKKYFKKNGIKYNLIKAYKSIENKAGKQANIIVAGYPQLFSNLGGKECGFFISPTEAKVINQNVSLFNNELENNVNSCRQEGMNIYFVSVEDEFIRRGGGAYSEKELLNGVFLGTKPEDLKDFNISSAYSVHPNDQGAQVYADCVQGKINELEGIDSSEEGEQDTEEKVTIPDDAVEFKGHRYCLYKGAKSYNEALNFCKYQGGYLATITSKEENDFLFEYMKEQGYQNAYFGLSDSNVEGDWKWVNDEAVDFTNWHTNEPNSENESEDYAMFYYKYGDGTWSDGDFGNKTVNDYGNEDDKEIIFICEWGEYEKEKSPISENQNIILTLDTSGSMSGTSMNETKKASHKFIDTVLNADAGIGLVTYNSSSYVKSGLSRTKNKLNKKVEECDASGGTNMESGLRDAVDLLNQTESKKKTIVMMSDGEPNEGLIGDALVDYANGVKESGINIYTVGFFSDVNLKTEQQLLMEELASPGCHYEVANAEGLTNFFSDIADQINGQKYIYIRVACPVDVSITYDGETLDSSKDLIEGRTGFGTLTYENSSEDNNRIKVIRLKEGPEYDVKIVGTGYGIMNYTIGFMNEDGEYDDFRKFMNIRITDKTEIDTVADVSENSILKIDEDGDGKYDLKLAAKKNSRGELIKESLVFIYVGIGIFAILVLVLVIYLVRKIRKFLKER